MCAERAQPVRKACISFVGRSQNLRSDFICKEGTKLLLVCAIAFICIAFSIGCSLENETIFVGVGRAYFSLELFFHWPNPTTYASTNEGRAGNEQVCHTSYVNTVGEPQWLTWVLDLVGPNHWTTI